MECVTLHQGFVYWFFGVLWESLEQIILFAKANIFYLKWRLSL
jgi:hypothetical protein